MIGIIECKVYDDKKIGNITIWEVLESLFSKYLKSCDWDYNLDYYTQVIIFPCKLAVYINGFTFFFFTYLIKIRKGHNVIGL